MKLAICLQVCPVDVWLGLRVVRLITSIEAVKRDDIEFIVSARRDTNPNAVSDIARAASERFQPVHIIKGKRFGKGWPNGCNDLWQETMFRVSQMVDAGKIKADGVLTFEADCIPLRPDWLDLLADEWRKGRDAGKDVVGHAHRWPETEDPTHINGNAIFSVHATTKWPDLNGCDSRSGWDAFHGKLLLRIGQDTSAIFQRYRIREISREEIEAIRKNDQIPALFHGIKGTIGMEAVETMIADGSFFKRP